MDHADRDLGPAFLHGEDTAGERLHALREEHEVAAAAVRFFRGGAIELEELVEAEPLHALVRVEEDAVLGSRVDGRLQFRGVFHEVRESRFISELLGVEHHHVEARPELAELIDEILHLLRDLGFGFGGVAVPQFTREAERAMFLQHDDGRGIVRPQFPEFVRHA